MSTLHVIEKTRKALFRFFFLEEVYKDVTLVDSYRDLNKSRLEQVDIKKKIAIITACLTGEGASIAIKSFLNNNLKYDKEVFEIVPLNCLDKNTLKKRL